MRSRLLQPGTASHDADDLRGITDVNVGQFHAGAPIL